jgi:aliphatic nitrilase
VTGTSTFRAAAVQESPVWLDRDASIDKACNLIAAAAAGGADIVAFPESFVPGFPYWVFTHPPAQAADWHRRLHDNAVTVPGPQVDRLAAACARAGLISVVGVTERDAGNVGTLYNTNLVFGSDGTLLGKHRKLVATFSERVVWAGGDGSTLGVFPTPWGPLGTLCCGENLNTLARFALLAQGERIHVANFPSAAMAGARHTREELFLHVAPHAYEGKVYSIVASDCGSAELAARLGQDMSRAHGSYNCISGVVGPDGTWVAPPLIDEPGIAYADCPLDAITNGRLFHDITGHYNRFDVLELTLNRTPVAGRPLRFRDAPG